MSELTVREYVDQRFRDLELRLSDYMAATERSVSKAEHQIQVRMDNMNEFRNTLKDQAAHFITRSEFDKLDNDVRILQQGKANLDGRILATSALVGLIVSTIMWLVSHFAR